MHRIIQNIKDTGIVVATIPLAVESAREMRLTAQGYTDLINEVTGITITFDNDIEGDYTLRYMVLNFLLKLDDKSTDTEINELLVAAHDKALSYIGNNPWCHSHRKKSKEEQVDEC